MPLSRRRLLAASAAAMGVPLLGAATATASRKLLVVFAQGGWDVTFAIDPKQGVEGFDGPSVGDDRELESVEVFSGIPVQVNPIKRPAVRDLFRAWADRICVVNGLWVGAVTHWDAQGRVLTGTTDATAPDLATVVGLAHDTGGLPLVAADFSSIGRFGPHAARTARFGRTGQIAGLLDPAARIGDTQRPSYRGLALDHDDRAALLAYLVDDPAIDAWADRPGASAILADRAEALRRAGLLAGVTVDVGDTYTLKAQLDAAVGLLASGVCHAAVVETGQSWDTHLDEPAQHQLWNALCGDLVGLMERLVEEGLDQTITVVVLSEMARTPRRNTWNGCDHWPHTSAMLMGAGVGGGRVVGATDELFHSVAIDLDAGAPSATGVVPRPENLVAGVLEALDVDPAPWLPGVAPLRAFRA